MNILIGTKNPYKAEVMEYMLKDIPNLNIHFLKDMDISLDIEEDQDSLIGNAKKKALEISRHTDMYVLTSDGGVEVPALGKKWDILTNQRTVGHNNSDSIKIKIFLKLMTGLKGEERKVEYRLALALALKGKIIDSFEDTTDRGYIIEKLTDKDIPFGMWMGHIWYYPQYKKTYTRLNKEELKMVMEQGDGIKEKLRTKIIELYTDVN